jgi:hypothetical protein
LSILENHQIAGNKTSTRVLFTSSKEEQEKPE